MTQPLEEIQDRIVEQLHAGESVDQAAILAAHPEHAEALRGFFRVLELVEKSEPPVAAASRLGEFQILRELGRGGMGVVYEAEQLSLKRRVALKVLPPALGHDARLKARFQREAEAAGKLRHPGIVPVISFGDLEGTPFFAMELVEGRSLARVLADLREGHDAGVPPAGELRRRWAIGIAIAMAEALSYAHAEGIVHRDVKPGNILIDREGKPRLSDFGLAQDLGMEGLTISGESLGSPRYMSPEQAFRRNLPVDQRTDIYSLGVTLYEMLTLRYPYEGATSVEYMNELSQGRVVLPRKLDAAIPAALECVLLRALAKEPEQRYADAAALADDLKAVLEGRTLAEGTKALLGRGTRKFSRHPLFWAGVAATLIVVATVGCHWMNREVATSLGPTSEWTVGGTHGVRLGDLDKILRESHVRVELRRFISRRDPGSYVYALDLPQGVGEGQEWDPDIHWSVSLDGKNWKSISVAPAASADGIPATREITPGLLCLRVALKDVLGGALESESITIHHRLDRLELRHAGEVDPQMTQTREPNEFTQTAFIYDELPADYPEAFSNPELDEELRSMLTPHNASFVGTSSLDGGTKAIRVWFDLPAPNFPAPVAGELMLFRLGSETPIAHGRLVRAKRQSNDSDYLPIVASVRPAMREGHLLWRAEQDCGPSATIDFVLEAMPPEKEVQLLLDLQQGSIHELRFLFEASKTVARESSYFDRFWSGTIDVTVPLKVAPEIR